ncbi:hypothetical protein LTR94_029896, partial [Friedmanniomyces endolithicus]
VRGNRIFEPSEKRAVPSGFGQAVLRSPGHRGYPASDRSSFDDPICPLEGRSLSRRRRSCADGDGVARLHQGAPGQMDDAGTNERPRRQDGLSRHQGLSGVRQLLRNLRPHQGRQARRGLFQPGERRGRSEQRRL